MKKNFGIISVIIFALTLLLYIISLYNGIEFLPGKLTLAILIIGPIIGIILSASTNKKSTKFVGLAGNSFVLLIAGIIPLIASVLWNKP